MIQLKWLILVHSMCFLSIILKFSASQEQNPCEIYTSNYTCEAQNASTRADPAPDCGTSVVETTLKLMTEGAEVITEQLKKIKNNRESVLMIGKTGTGKSTLTFFIAGNDSSMIAYQTDPESYGIKDCNGKIGGSSIISQTTFPELVLESRTNTAFFDYPGFLDTRPVCAEISNAFFMLKVATELERVKLVIVLNYAAVKEGGDKTEYLNLVRSIIDFIPGIEDMENGLSIIATKVGGQKNDQEYVEYISKFLETVLPDLDKIFTDPDDLSKAKFITNQVKNSSRIGVFRQPNMCGTLNNIPFMQTNKNNLNMVIGNLSFVNVYPDYFSISLSGKSQNELSKIKLKLNLDIEIALSELADTVYNYIKSKVNCNGQQDCTKIIDVIIDLYSDIDFSNEYRDSGSWDKLTFAEIINQTTEVYYAIPNIIIPDQILSSLLSYTDYFKVLDILDDSGNGTITNPVLWFEPLREMKRNLALDVSSLCKVLRSTVETAIENFSYAVHSNLISETECEGDQCTIMLKNFKTLYNNIDFKNRYNYTGTWGNLTFNEITNRLTNYVFDGFNIDPDVMLSLNAGSQNLDALHNSGIDVSVDIERWLLKPRDLKDTVTSKVVELRDSFVKTVKSSLLIFSDEVKNGLANQFKCQTEVECEQIISALEAIYNDSEFIAGYISFDSSRTSLQLLINETTSIYYSLKEVTISESNSDSLKVYSLYIDALQELEKSVLETDEIFRPMRDIKTNLESELLALNSNFNKKVESLLELYTGSLIVKMFPGLECGKEKCAEVLVDVTSLSSNPDFVIGYKFPDSWISDSTETNLIRLTNLPFTGFEIEKETTASIKLHSQYLDRLYALSNALIISKETWLLKFRSMKKDFVAKINNYLKPSVYKLIQNAINSMYGNIVDQKIEVFNNLNDVYAVQTEIETLLKLISEFKLLINSKLDSSLNAPTFLEETFKNFVDLGQTQPSETFYAIFNSKPYFSFFTDNEYNTVIDEGQRLSWLLALTGFDGLMENEKIWYNFLVELLHDLSDSKTQVEETYSFRSWWETNQQNIPDNDTNVKLTSFWNTFSSVPAMKNLYLSTAITLLSKSSDRTKKFESLNLLLKETLEGNLECTGEEALSCSGVFVSLKKVVSKLSAITTSVTVNALHTVYVDSSIAGSNYLNNLNVIVIAPTWITSGTFIDLSGKDGNPPTTVAGANGAHGKPGNVGGNAGNFYGIGENFPVAIPTISVVGGKGGNGQDGQDGSNGVGGSIRKVTCVNNDVVCASSCKATTGRVKLDSKFEPFTCASSESSSSGCKAGDGGVWFTIKGTEGGSGGNAGHGGRGGIGGIGGTAHLRVIGSTSGYDLDRVDGALGYPGKGARPGKGSIDGNYYKIKIDDVSGRRIGERADKVCQRNGEDDTVIGELRPDGELGYDGASPENPSSPSTPLEFEYKTLVPVSKTEFDTFSTTYLSSPFFRTKLSSFITRMKELPV